MKKINWMVIGSYITSALTLLAMIPYDKDYMDMVGKVFPPTWIPFVIKTGIASTFILRVINHIKQQNEKPTTN